MRRPCNIEEIELNPLGEYQVAASIREVKCYGVTAEGTAKMLAEILEMRAREIRAWIMDGCP